MRPRLTLAFAMAAACLSSAGYAQQNAGRLTWAAPESGSRGYEEVRTLAAALGSGDAKIRLEGTGSHLARSRMLRDNRARFAATSLAGSFFAQEGLSAYAVRDWGPQPVRAVLVNMHAQLYGVVAAADAGIGSISDLKGKRVARVSDAPELDHHLAALLALADLTWSDVTVVSVNRYGAAIESIVGNRADAAFATSITPDLQKLAKSPRGLSWPIVAHADPAGWQALRSVAPYVLAVDATEGAGLSDKTPVEGINWPYPIVITLAKTPSDEVRQITSAAISRFPRYRNEAPGNAGWEARRQPLTWAIPWHEGAVQAFREQGLWTHIHQAHQEGLLRRQQVLQQAWEAHRKATTAPGAEEGADEAEWLKARATALRHAGLDALTDTNPASGKAPAGPAR